MSGSDDLRSQDEKGSDGGEGSSPSHHDHEDHHQHPFNEGSDEVEEGDRSVVYPFISDIKPKEDIPGDIANAEVVGGQEVSVGEIESELKLGESSDQINDNVENVRSFEESLDGYGKSSGVVSDEFLNEAYSKGELYNSQQKAVTSEDITFPVDYNTEEAEGQGGIIKVVSDLKSEKSSDRIDDIVAHVNYASELVGEQEVSAVNIVSGLEHEKSSDRINKRLDYVESALRSSYGNGNSSDTSKVGNLNADNSKDEPDNSKQTAIISEDSADLVDSPPTQISSASDNTSVKETRNLVVEPYADSVKEVTSLSEVKSGDTGSASLVESTVPQEAAVDLAMKKHEDKVFPLPDQHVTTPDLVKSQPKEYSSGVSATAAEKPIPATESTKVADRTNGSETPECSENQVSIWLKVLLDTS